MHIAVTPVPRTVPATEEENRFWMAAWMELQGANRKMRNRDGFFFSGLESQILFNCNQNDCTDQGFGNLWQWVESQLKKGSDHHLWQLVERGWAAVICNHPWKALCMKHKLEENFVQILHGEYFYLFIFFLHTLKRTVWISFPQKQLWAWSIYRSSSEGPWKRCLRFELSKSQRLVMNYYKVTGDLVIIQRLLEKHWEH